MTIHLETINLWKFNIYAVLEATKNNNIDREQENYSSTATSMAIDEQILLDLSFTTTSITLLTCLFHGLFEFLAFKNGKFLYIKLQSTTLHANFIFGLVENVRYFILDKENE